MSMWLKKIISNSYISDLNVGRTVMLGNTEFNISADTK